jgi:hypothetical protein
MRNKYELYYYSLNENKSGLASREDVLLPKLIKTQFAI